MKKKNDIKNEISNEGKRYTAIITMTTTATKIIKTGVFGLKFTVV